MSLLIRRLDKIVRDLKTRRSINYVLDLKDSVLDTVERVKVRLGYYNVRNFITNLSLFLKLAWHWRPWDNTYTLEAFVILLKAQAQCLKSRDVKIYRRCMTAAGLIEKSHEYSDWSDKGFVRQYDLNPIKLEKGRGLVRSFNVSEEYHTKIMKIIEDRVERTKKEMRENAWKYYNKYCDTFWD